MGDVYALDLEALSRIAGVPEEDLVAGLQSESKHVVTAPHAFDGFVVGVDQIVLHPSETTSLLPVTRPRTAKAKLKTAVRTIGRLQVTAKHIVERRKAAFLESTTPLPLPVPAPLLLTSRSALLIPVAEDATEYVLAVPDSAPSDVYLDESTEAALVRRFSHLPTNITHVSVETVYDSGSDHLMHVQLVVEKRVPFVGYALLIAALLTISSLGAALDLQAGVDPFVKLFWRTTASILGFLPFAFYSVHAYGWPRWTPSLLLLFLFSCVSYALFLMTFLWSLNHTSIGHAYIFNNCHSLLIVLGKVLLGKPVLAFEALGSALGIVGGVVTTLDHSSVDVASGAVPPSWQGDVVALVGAVGGVFYLLTAKKLRADIDVFLYMTLLFVVTMLLHFPVLYVLGIPNDLWSIDRTIGLFGWVQADRLGIELYLVFVCTIIGTMGYISVMKYFDPIVVSVVMLLEPVLATAIGVLLGVDSIPGVLTWIGGILVIAGTCLVVLAANKKTEAHDATEAIIATSSSQKGPVHMCTVSTRRG
ncbi:hypothetical protein SPRG_05038 [Saprolegnia parasitica CBS 223.65]|uniref:EamA domain-containing protein n=1 Tax=Saprolegnia parasitica (strain CBS 223.65) TaxID=695850 RepID=A0A067CU61_SAPPC|nr:hypothetical protein SPRG_05038 [Saprolegnia parasitica CBS 223.65]KDO30327.1 hypothetical protein SPRG_05038 [Saprolegnia parasitica CBS 223.65]|eukprot:XP_012198937.1 hypothetical protein SPRG_05038 [Saprolegnia parasitica CBS 223.65]